MVAELQTALVLWSEEDSEIRCNLDDMVDALRAERVSVQPANLPALMGALTLAKSVAAWASDALEAQVVARVAGQALGEDLRRLRPELAVATDPLSAVVAATWRRRGLLPAALLGTATATLAVDPRWASEGGVDRLLVVDRPQAEQAGELGLSAEVVALAAPAAFAAAGTRDRVDLRHRHGLPEQRPVLLVAAEGLELDELSEMLLQLSLLPGRATILVDTGGDETVSELLRQRAELYDVPAQMFGAVDEAPELWAACDVVCARPTARVERRALAAGLLLCGYAPQDQAQQQRVAAFVERGIGAAVERPAVLAVELERLLETKVLEAGRAVFDEVRAGEPLAAAVLRLGADAGQLLAGALERGPGPVGGEEAPRERPVEPARQRGPLEAIGPGRAAGADPQQEAARWEAAGRKTARAFQQLEAEEALEQLKAEAFGSRDAVPVGTPRRAPAAAGVQPSPASTARPGVGIDPGVKQGPEDRGQQVEDALAALKKKVRDE